MCSYFNVIVATTLRLNRRKLPTELLLFVSLSTLAESAYIVAVRLSRGANCPQV